MESYVRLEKVDKGMSGDEKLRLWGDDGTICLLRISEPHQYERKKREFELTQTAWRAGIPTAQPLEFGFLPDGRVFQRFSWIDGEDVESLLPHISEEEQRNLGRMAGVLLRRLHTLPAPADAVPWETRFRRKVETRMGELAARVEAPVIQQLYACIQYALLPREQCFAHGDYNPGNLILRPEVGLGLIDFNAYQLGYGEPWFELGVIAGDESLPGAFRTAAVDAYFESHVPSTFHAVLSVYQAYGALARLCEEEDFQSAYTAAENVAKTIAKRNHL